MQTYRISLADKIFTWCAIIYKKSPNSSCTLFCCTFFASCTSCILCDKTMCSPSNLKHLKIQTDTADLNIFNSYFSDDLNPEILRLQYCVIWIKPSCILYVYDWWFVISLSQTKKHSETYSVLWCCFLKIEKKIKFSILV